MKKVSIFTDGSCLGNGKSDAYGGWAAILVYTDKNGKDHRAQFTGNAKSTTNNRMELTAAVQGISKLQTPCEVIVFTDSTYVCQSAGKVDKLASDNWHTSKYYAVKNGDLLEQLWQVITDGKHVIKFQHIDGHKGHPENEKADALARSSARALKALEAANA